MLCCEGDIIEEGNEDRKHRERKMQISHNLQK